MEHVQMCFECLNMYFEGDPPHDQFFCRALMCQVYCMNNSVFRLFSCIWFVSYSTHFLVFNTSVLYFQGVRPLLQPGLCQHLVPSLKQVVKGLEEVADQDHSWRAELMMQVTDFTNMSNIYAFESDHTHRTSMAQITLFKCRESYKLCFLSGICRVTFLLELALLSLQVKDQEVAADCWEQLKLAEEVVSVNILFKTSGKEKYVQLRNPQCAGVLPQARLKEIEKLDQWLEAAVKEGRPQAAQALCASQWHLCLPLLQHNLRKCIKMPLIKLALVLEYTQSMSLEMRCEVHSELAAIEEEEGDLKATLSHLEKALLLDNGTYGERLSSALHLLQLRRTPYLTPACPLDKAAKIITDRRPLLVSVGLLLAPFDFQTALDADHHTKCTDVFSLISLLSNVLHCFVPLPLNFSGFYFKSLCLYPFYPACRSSFILQSKLFTCCGDNISTKIKLWVTLAKTARKLEVWDVCRAACRFCLLYDGGAGKSAETNSEKKIQTFKKVKLASEFVAHYFLFLFILKLFTTHKKSLFLFSSSLTAFFISYWIQSLSAYATRCFLRGGEIGVEIGEHCLVENAAIYLWNYNTHMLAAEEYKLLLPTFQNLVEMLLRMKDIRYNLTMCVMACNAVSRGLMLQPVCDSVRSSAKGKHSASKHGTPDTAGLKDVKKALEVRLCEYALRISSGDRTRETVPIAVRKLALTSWVQIKQLLHQQIGRCSPSCLQSDNKEVAAMSRVLVGLEMLNCNRHPKQMDFSAPSLSTLAGMASECSWLDAVVELQVWCQLAAFCHSAEDHSLVLLCTEKALQLEKAAEDGLTTAPCLL
uniref:Cilia and flagella associated protein 46 n=1 Tax=Poecilia reticulata TaxID=8081 RepID=A0A3P9P3C7_POERE